MLSRQFTELQGEKGREIGPHTLHFNKREKNKETRRIAFEAMYKTDLTAANPNEKQAPRIQGGARRGGLQGHARSHRGAIQE